MRQREENTRTEERAMSTGRASRRGFGAHNKAAAALNQKNFQVKDDAEVIIFLEEENFESENRHWIKYTDGSGQQATRAEWCLGVDEDGESVCPLCDISDTPKPVAFFNVVDVANPGKVLVWEASSDPTKAIEKEFKKLAAKRQHLNDDNLYWVVTRERGKNGFYTYSVDRLTEEELSDAWESLAPISAVKREALRNRMYDESYIEYKDRDELQEFVDSL